MGVTFTDSGARKIAAVVKRVLNTPEDRTGDRTRSTTTETQFWAMLVGSDVTGLRSKFVRVIPVAQKDRADFTIGKDLPLYYEVASDQPEEGWAREANGNRGIPLYTTVLLTFIGEDAEGLPAYLFTYGDAREEQALRPHDHRDMWNGGFAFSCYHPGTGLPQQPWAI